MLFWQINLVIVFPCMHETIDLIGQMAFWEMSPTCNVSVHSIG